MRPSSPMICLVNLSSSSALLAYCFSLTADYLIPIIGGPVQGKASGVDLLWPTNNFTSSGITYTPIVSSGPPDSGITRSWLCHTAEAGRPWSPLACSPQWLAPPEYGRKDLCAVREGARAPSRGMSGSQAWGFPPGLRTSPTMRADLGASRLSYRFSKPVPRDWLH